MDLAVVVDFDVTLEVNDSSSELEVAGAESFSAPDCVSVGSEVVETLQSTD